MNDVIIVVLEYHSINQLNNLSFIESYLSLGFKIIDCRKKRKKTNIDIFQFKSNDIIIHQKHAGE